MFASFCDFFGGEIYKDHFEEGIYVCSECGHELFASTNKYEHQTPWPAFTQTLHDDSVKKYKERPNALKVKCGKCDNGLGHEFINDRGPGQSRFWIFSASLKFVAKKLSAKEKAKTDAAAACNDEGGKWSK